MLSAFNNKFKNQQSRLSNAVAKLDALSPLKVLSRGYSIAEINGKVLTSVNDAELGDRLALNFSDGKLLCTVDGKEK